MGRAARSANPLRTGFLSTENDADEQISRARYLETINRVLITHFIGSPFRATLDAFKLGALHIVGLVATARHSERTPALIAQDRHDGISFQYVVSGTAHGVAGDRTLVSSPGSIMMLDFAQPFAMRDMDTRDVINVSVPRALIAKVGIDPRDLHGRLLDPVASALLGGMLVAVWPQLPRLDPELAAPLAQILFDLIALLVRSAGADAVALSPRERLRGRAQQVISSRLGAALLTPEWLATRLNVSRSDLYAAFQDEGGVSKAIWRLRLEGARDALLEPAEKRRIGEIAFAFGFASESHFARVFRAMFGMTAGEARLRSISKQ